MAKKKAASGNGTQSKSGLVREYIQTHPDAGNKDIEKALAHTGVKYTDVTNARASLAKMGKTAKKAARKVKAAKPAKRAATSTTVGPVAAGAAERLGKAALYAKECGSIDSALAALQELKGLLG